MAKDKPSQENDPLMHAPLLAMRIFEGEIAKTLEKTGTALARGDVRQLSGLESYSILLFLTEFSEAGLSEKRYKTFLAKYEIDTPAHLKNYPMLSQTVLFELFRDHDVSRESIRRLLILLAQYGLIDRVSKGPPTPDRLSISKAGRKLMGRVSKRLSKALDKSKAFDYL